MRELVRLKADVAKLVATRDGGPHPTAIQLALRHQRHFFDSYEKVPVDYWEPLAFSPPGTPGGHAFDLACKFDEGRIWQQADREGLRRN